MEHDRTRTETEHVPTSPPALYSSTSSPSAAAAAAVAGSSPVAAGRDKTRSVDHDSLVTVRLSEPPPSLHVNTSVGSGPVPPPKKTPYGNEYTPSDAMAEAVREEEAEEDDGDGKRQQQQPRSPSWRAGEGRSLGDELCEAGEEEAAADDGTGRMGDGDDDDNERPEDRDHARPVHRRDSSASDVDWNGLQKTEDEECKGQKPGNQASVLLARLDQENDRLATNSKTIKVQGPQEGQEAKAARRKTRPPSTAQLQQMVSGPTPAALRYSMVPPPPLTDLEFYAAVVKDYQQTAARLPTLLANKIRKGIPPPLRGVVWQSMSGARDPALEEVFERLAGEPSPYEGIIGKDLGRSFPGVDMFRDPDGEGQRMLGRVLKCFSLYDDKIGYCQGLAFLVGPLLMHMPDRQAFCVLVRLMEHYDLRGCFLPDLSGLHTRIYQFRELLRQSLPAVWAHLEDLQVDPAYVSQWFLSFFAVTCPLPMLFRIYDVVFAEGASVTIMRVALSLMHENQARILACAEMGDVMQLLLSRGLWDCYHYNADEFVQAFTSLAAVVSRENLAALELRYREAQLAANSANNSTSTTPISTPLTATAPTSSTLSAPSTARNTSAPPRSTDAGRAADVTTAASRFLGRLWASSPTPKLASSSTASTNTSTSTSTSSTSTISTINPPNARCSTATISTTTTLSPGLAAPPRPLSMLRRSASKQSLASTLNSMEAGPSSTTSSSASVLSSASTDATSISRDSSTADDSPIRGSGPASAGAPAPPPKPAIITSAGGSGSGGGSNSNAITSTNSNSASSKDDTRHLHSQIEDLLTALSELQRNHTLLADQLQKEREEHDEDKKAVRSLLHGLKNKSAAAVSAAGTTSPSRDSEETITSDGKPRPGGGPISSLVETVEQRFGDAVDDRRSSIPQTKSQLRDELARAKAQLSDEFAKTQGYNRRILELEQDVSNGKDQLKESHAHVRNLHQEKQRLEKQIQGLKTRASDTPSSVQDASDWFSRTMGLSGGSSGAGSGGGGGGGDGTAAPSATSGLRELKLGRSRSTPSQATSYNKRQSSLTIQSAVNGGRDSSATGAPLTAPVSEHDSLLLELVQAKTAEAIAKQEAEEAKQKLENLRKAFGLAPGEVPPANSAATTATSAAFSVFGRLTGSTATAAPAATADTSKPLPPLTQSATAPPATTGGGGGFWGWRR